MKYFMGFARVLIMTTDIALIAAEAFVFYFFWDSFPANIIMLLLAVIMFKSWKNSGGSIAWKSRNAGG